MKILKEAYHYWGAEGLCRTLHVRHAGGLTHTSSAVVFITSNYIGNSEIMQGCMEAGIPVFGTLWDFVGVVFAIFSECWWLTF
jgi:hypothetical protein